MRGVKTRARLWGCLSLGRLYFGRINLITTRRLLSPRQIKYLLRTVILVALLAFGYQFYWIGRRTDWVAFGAALTRPGNWRYLFLVLVMMPVNWLLEGRKWHLLLRAFLPWKFGRTLVATLAGVSLSAATPNRIGEIGGRLLLAKRQELAGVAASSLLGSLCQWTAFLLLAWPGLVWTLGWPLWLFLMGPACLLLLWLGGKPLLMGILRAIARYLNWPTDHIKSALSDVKLITLVRAGAYACLRFSVYCLQLVLLLRFFGLVLPWGRGLAGTAAIYLVQAGLPLPPGLNLLTRTELGLLVWQAETGGAAGVAVLAGFTTLFAVNVLLPAVPGYWFIVRKKKK